MGELVMTTAVAVEKVEAGGAASAAPPVTISRRVGGVIYPMHRSHDSCLTCQSGFVFEIEAMAIRGLGPARILAIIQEGHPDFDVSIHSIKRHLKNHTARDALMHQVVAYESMQARGVDPDEMVGLAIDNVSFLEGIRNRAQEAMNLRQVTPSLSEAIAATNTLMRHERDSSLDDANTIYVTALERMLHLAHETMPQEQYEALVERIRDDPQMLALAGLAPSGSDGRSTDPDSEQALETG
jgi:hypothetical protein